MAKLTEDFLNHFYHALRSDYLERTKAEGSPPLAEVFLGLTRNNPALLTCDKAMQPNGSIKSVGFILKEEFIDEMIAAYDQFLNWRWGKVKGSEGPGYEGKGWVYSPNLEFIRPGLELALKHIYLEEEEAEKRLDFSKLGTLEGFQTRSWKNLQENKKAALIYYYPPGISFQVNCTVEIQESGKIREMINRAACLAHGENPEKWPKRTAYIFHVDEVIDKSVYPSG